jgi:glutamate--cysteine ligase catalytic subunit
MSASSPIWRGYLAEIDCRWNVLCAMSDDRTSEERGFEVNKNSFSVKSFGLKKSFYCSSKKHIFVIYSAETKANHCSLFSH